MSSDSNESSPLSVKIEATAKYTVTQEIPEDVTRKGADALLDLISPLVQMAGVVGDALKFHRAKLQLNQERALQQLALEYVKVVKPGSDASQLPPKFVYPLLRDASVEDPSGELIKLLARLLASAAEGYLDAHVSYVGILNRMSPRQAELFTSIVGNLSIDELIDAKSLLLYFNQITDDVNKITKSPSAYPDTFGKVKGLKALFQVPGVQLREADCRGKDSEGVKPARRKVMLEPDSDIYALTALGLISNPIGAHFDFDDICCTFRYVYITPLGVDLAVACKMYKGGGDARNEN